MDTKQRLTKAINFFRAFSNKADTDLYRRSVLRFCDLVEESLGVQKPDATIEDAKKVFGEQEPLA